MNIIKIIKLKEFKSILMNWNNRIIFLKIKDCCSSLINWFFERLAKKGININIPMPSRILVIINNPNPIYIFRPKYFL